MINKKTSSLIAMVAIVAVASIMYGINETSPTIHKYVAGSQFNSYTFDQSVEMNPLTVVGVITDVGVKVFEDAEYSTDMNGDQYISQEAGRPKAEITIRVIEVLNDDGTVQFGKTVTFYDSHVEGAIGKVDGSTAMYHSKYAVDYKVGDRGIFIINEDHGLNLMGFTSYYPLTTGLSTMTSGLDKLGDKAPIDVEQAKQTAKLLAQNAP